MPVTARLKIGPPLLLAGLVIVLFAPPLLVVVNQYNDYGAHLGFVRGLLVQGDWQLFLARVPHFLFHALVLVVYRLLPNLGAAGFIVALLLYVALALALYDVLRRLLGPADTRDRTLFYMLVTVVTMLVMPINLFTPDHPYHGYIATNVYHNPTIAALKPLAVLLFGIAALAFDARPSPVVWYRALGLAAITILSMLAKPSYILILLPALLLLMLHYRLLRRRMDWRLLFLGVILPGALMLGVQALLFDASAIVFAPLAFFYLQGVMDGLLLKLLLSILFPLAVTLAHFRAAARSAPLLLAWLSFVFGVALTYLFAEANRAGHGNLTWSGQIGAFILFLAALVFWLRQNRLLSFSDVPNVTLSPAFVTTGALLVFHLISGLLWYFTFASGRLPTG
ncbi:MAG: hypothetical protein HZC41_15675 [Chloroflexi bacterium]|nr:hypothetical protein [Chloroflexota bacterium]